MTDYTIQLNTVYNTLVKKINSILEPDPVSPEVMEKLTPKIHYIEEVIQENDHDLSKTILELYYEVKEVNECIHSTKKEFTTLVRNLNHLTNICLNYRYPVERVVGSGVVISKSNPQYLLSKQKDWKFIKKTGESS
jgi:hypothetical protein